MIKGSNLCTIYLTQDQLSRTLMPCGAYSKTEIREIAEKIGLEVFRKKDSQEIALFCLIIITEDLLKNLLGKL